jgi:hypothetical protein
MQERIAVFSVLLDAFTPRHAGNGAIVYGKHERLQRLGYLVRVRNGLEEHRLESGYVQHLDQRVHVLFICVPEQVGVLLRRVQRQHVDAGGAVSEDEALVLCREGRFGIWLVLIVGLFDEDGLEIFDLCRVSALRVSIAGACALTSLFRLAQKLLLI